MRQSWTQQSWTQKREFILIFKKDVGNWQIRKIQRREPNSGIAGDILPKSLLRELSIIDVEYTSQMTVEGEPTLNSGQVVNYSVLEAMEGILNALKVTKIFLNTHAWWT